MNTLDYVILGILLVSLAIGLWRGLLENLKKLIKLVGACFLSVLVYPITARFLSAQEGLTSAIRGFFEQNAVFNSLAEMAAEPVNSALGRMDEIVATVKLPAVFTDMLEKAMQTQAFGESTVGDYAVHTAVTLCINVLAFLVTFIVLYLVMAVVVYLLRELFKAPLLNQVDTLAGAVLGLVCGYVIITVLFALLPMAQSMLTSVDIAGLVEASTLAPIFTEANPIAGVINAAIAKVIPGAEG